MFGRIGMSELLVILVLALLLFGPGKLPDVGKALGKAIGEFKKGAAGESDDKPDTKDSSSKKG